MGAKKSESTSIFKLDKNEEGRKRLIVEGTVETGPDKETIKNLSREELNRCNRHMQAKEQTDSGKKP